MNMTVVKSYDWVADDRLKFAVILAKYKDSYVFCKHRERNTLELPGGHREPGETILEAARRELMEETGALAFSLDQVCVYSVTSPNQFDGEETFGMLYFAQVETLSQELHSEIEKIFLLKELPSNWTYPQIQPRLIAFAEERGF